MRSKSKKPEANPVMPVAAITLRFPDGSWEYCATERVPEAGDTLVRAGVTWIVVGVTEAVDDHRVVTMAAPAPEIRLPIVRRKPDVADSGQAQDRGARARGGRLNLAALPPWGATS